MSGLASPDRAAADMIETGRLLHEKSLIASTEGNLSVRLGGDRFLITPSGACKGRLKAADLITVDGSGRRLAGEGKPTSELALHLALYEARPDRNAIVHAHPPTATGFAVAGVPLADCVLPEILLTVGSVPTTPYATPGEKELAEKVIPTAKEHDAFLLKNHGALALGIDIWEAYYRMEMIESFAKTLLTARTLGKVEPLTPDEVSRLLGTRPGPAAAGDRGPGYTCSEGEAEREDDLIGEVLRRVEKRLAEERGRS